MIIFDETTIENYLDATVDAEELDRAVIAAVERVSPIHERIHVKPMTRDCVVTSEMLVRLCDAALERRIATAALRIVAFIIVSSDRLAWRDDFIGEVLHDWAAPEVNRSLSQENLRQFRRWLTREEPYPERPTGEAAARGAYEIVSRLERVLV
jgi:hypothetical protein